MAETEMPKPNSESSLIREKSSLSGPLSETSKTSETKAIAKLPKKTFAMKLKETFISEDATSVGDYILWDILVPTVKRTIRDVIVGSADRVFLGSTTPPSNNLYRSQGVTYVNPSRTNYSSITRPQRKVESRQNVQQLTGNRRAFEVLDLIFEDYGKIHQAFDETIDLLDQYGQVSVDQYAEILSQYFNGIPNMEYTAQNFGWKSLATAEIVKVVGGYYVKFPRPIPLS